MITVIPSFEIMKAVTDNNLTSDNAKLRRDSFTVANDIMSLADVDILLEGGLYERVKIRLNEDHKKFFESIYRIDDSAKGVAGYGIISSINWIAESESRTRRVIILTDNKASYSLSNARIVCMTPRDFLDRIERARKLYEGKAFSSFNDSLIVVFFFTV